MTASRGISSERTGSHSRARLLDMLRGFSVISMVLFHLCYDLVYLAHVDLSFFYPPLQDVWRASISWTFLFIAGISCSLSRNNMKRSMRYLALALVIYVATAFLAVDTPISFGIIFCMGASTLIYAILERMNCQPIGWIWAAVFVLLFVLSLRVPYGSFGVGSLSMALPRAPYNLGYFSFAGFPGAGFVSGDYYPLIPYGLMYLAGASVGNLWKRAGWPQFVQEMGCAPLEFIGRHPLEIYLAHQPLLLLFLGLL